MQSGRLAVERAWRIWTVLVDGGMREIAAINDKPVLTGKAATDATEWMLIHDFNN